MKFSNLIIFLGIIVASSLSAGDRIVAIVGDSLILDSDISVEVDKYMQLSNNRDALTRNITYTKVLNSMIDNLVLIVHADRDSNIVITPSQIDRSVDDRISTIMNDNKITKEQLKMLLEEKENISYSDFRKALSKQIHQELIKQYVQQLYIGQRELTAPELKLFMDEYSDSLPQIGESVRLQKLEVEIKPDSTIRQLSYDSIIKIRENIVMKDSSFQNMANIFSAKEFNPSNNGGDLGFISKGALGQIRLENAIFALKPGEVSYPIETDFGFHLIKVSEKRDGKSHAYQIVIRVKPSESKIEKVKMKLENFISSNSDEVAFSNLVKELSTDNVTKDIGGDMGWKRISELKDEIKSAFSSNKFSIGNLSNLIEDKTTFRLYRVTDYKISRPLTIESDRDLIIRYAEQRNSAKKFSFLLDTWKKEVFIQKF